MLSYSELVMLERSHRGARVLSVYLDGSATDPAVQRSWRAQLDHALADLRTWLDDSSREERAEYADCARRLESELGAFGAGIGALGWAAFITSDAVQYAERVPMPMPTMAVWSTGMCVAPYMRALKESRPVIVAVMDARKASLYCYQWGELDHVATLHAHHVVEPPSHMGDSPRVGFHVGARGTAGRDVAQRSRREGMKRMLAEVAERATALAGRDGWILLGGIPRVVAHAARLLSPVAARVGRLASLDVHATPADIADVARTGASALRNAWDALQIDAIEEQAEAGALGVVGAVATDRALELSCVGALYISPRYLADHAADAERAVRRALDQDALVEEVSGEAEQRLEIHGGIVARLRYRSGAGIV